MAGDFIVREAEPRDANALVELANAVGSEPEGWLITTSNWRSAADERRYLRSIRRYEHAAVLVAEDDGVVIGRLSIGRDPHPASAHVADLGLMVAQEHRRRGVGWARAVGVRKIELHVFPHNTGAIAMYERFGFVREGYRKAHYRRPDGYVDAILMAYELTDEEEEAWR